MSYLDRLSTLRYTSPSGQEFALAFDGLRRDGGKKVPVTETPGHDTPIVQDLGEAALTYPVVCYIHGDDYDAEADRFWAALEEPGAGTLHHPRWGILSVIATTRIQRERFVDGAGAAVFEIAFVRLDDAQNEYPRVRVDDVAAVSSAVSAAAAAITATTKTTEGASAAALAAAKTALAAAAKSSEAAIGRITGISDSVRQEIDDATRSVNSAVDAVTGATTGAISAMISLYRLPAQAVADVTAKITGLQSLYRTLADSAISASAEYGAWLAAQGAAQILGAAAAIAESTTAGQVETRDDAVEILALLAGQADAIRRDVAALETSGGGMLDPVAVRATLTAYTRSIRTVVAQSMRLPRERREILDEDETPITLAHRYYGSMERLDELVSINRLSGDMLLLIPRGTEIVHYA